MPTDFESFSADWVAINSNDTLTYQRMLDAYERAAENYNCHYITTSSNTITLNSLGSLSNLRFISLTEDPNMPTPVPPTNLTSKSEYNNYIIKFLNHYFPAMYGRLPDIEILNDNTLKLKDTTIFITPEVTAIPGKTRHGDANTLQRVKISVTVPKKYQINGNKYKFFSPIASNGKLSGLEITIKTALNSFNASNLFKIECERREAAEAIEAAEAERRAEERLKSFKNNRSARTKIYEDVLEPITQKYNTDSVLDGHIVNVNLNDKIKVKLEADVNGAKVTEIEFNNTFTDTAQLIELFNKLQNSI